MDWAQCNQKWNLATHPSKAKKDTRLVEKERKGKESVLYFVCWHLVCEVGLCHPKANSTTDSQWAINFIDKERGIHAETAQSAYSHLEMDHLWPDHVILIVSSTVNLQFHGRFVSISLRSVLRTWQLTSWLQPGHRAVTSLLPGGGFSVCRAAHRVWLWMLSIAFEKELNVLDYA